TRSKRDWSSDVCSSDLDRGAAPARAALRAPSLRPAVPYAALRGLLGRTGLVLLAVGGRAADDPALLVHHAPAVSRRPGRDPGRQIGRASCRERVEISGC